MIWGLVIIMPIVVLVVGLIVVSIASHFAGEERGRIIGFCLALVYLAFSVRSGPLAMVIGTVLGLAWLSWYLFKREERSA